MDSLIASLPMWALLWPLILLGVCLLPCSDKRFTPWLVSAPLPAMFAAVFSMGQSLKLSPSPTMPLSLAIDAPGAVLLGVSGLLWATAATALPYKLADGTHRRRFSICWLLTLTGNLGVFLAADVMAFFVFYALASLPAYGMVIHEGSGQAKHAGKVYLGFALLGEAVLLIALILLVFNPNGGGHDIAAAVEGLGESPWRTATVILLLGAFGMKIGLVPAHGWLPLAHTVAPSPASAVLSGAILNVGVIGMIRFLPFGTDSPGAVWLVVFGFASAFFGVAMGLRRDHPKAMLAYSSVSQMGFIAAVTGMAMMHGNAAVLLPFAFYAAHHTLLKGGLFLATGWAEGRGGNRFVWWLPPVMLLGIGLGGLPLTGGWLAKVAVKDFFGNGMPGWLAMASSAATASLMAAFALRLTRKAGGTTDSSRNPTGMSAWWLLAVAAVALPWALKDHPGTIDLAKAFTANELWKAAWPVAVGAFLGAWFGMRPGSPQATGGLGAAVTDGIIRAVGRSCALLECSEGFMRRWTVGGVALVALVVTLALILLVSTS